MEPAISGKRIFVEHFAASQIALFFKGVLM
jgi:hypothetical protein